MSTLSTLRIILVGSESAGNIGAAARAIKTMGLSELWLVQPVCEPRSAEARFLAHNAEDVLESVRVVSTLGEALADAVFSVATTQRHRRAGLPFYTAREIAPMLLDRARGHIAAIVFGRESSGLTNEELALCSVVSTVPAATQTPSLNVAQAVMVYVYETFQAALVPQQAVYDWDLAKHEELEQFFDHLTQTLKQLGAVPAVSWERYIDKFRRIFNRMPLESRDVLLLHKLLKEVDRFVAQHR